MFVLDSNVVSALRVPGRHPAVEHWAASMPTRDLYTTAFTISEIERGVYAMDRRDPRQGAILRRWFSDGVLVAFADRVLDFNLAAARILASYRVPEHSPYDDALIAATAEAHGMTVVTRNIKHFTPLGVRVIDPWRTQEAPRR